LGLRERFRIDGRSSQPPRGDDVAGVVSPDRVGLRWSFADWRQQVARRRKEVERLAVAGQGHCLLVLDEFVDPP
jgi:hypothetical protein